MTGRVIEIGLQVIWLRVHPYRITANWAACQVGLVAMVFVLLVRFYKMSKFERYDNLSFWNFPNTFFCAKKSIITFYTTSRRTRSTLAFDCFLFSSPFHWSNRTWALKIGSLYRKHWNITWFPFQNKINFDERLWVSHHSFPYPILPPTTFPWNQGQLRWNQGPIHW